MVYRLTVTVVPITTPNDDSPLREEIPKLITFNTENEYSFRQSASRHKIGYLKETLILLPYPLSTSNISKL